MKNKGIMYRLDMKKAPKRCYGGENGIKIKLTNHLFYNNLLWLVGVVFGCLTLPEIQLYFSIK